MHIQISLDTKFHLKLTLLNFRISEFYIFNLILILNFSFNTQFWFLEQTSQKSILPIENRKRWTSLLNSSTLNIRISRNTNFQLKLTIWFFRPNLPRKVFSIKNWKSEHHHWKQHIQISLGAKFPLKLTVLIFSDRQLKLTISAQTDHFDFLDQICPKRYV